MNKLTDIYARKMIYNVLEQMPNAQQHVHNFLKHANDNNIQGAALVSYYTRFNKMPILAKNVIAETIDKACKNDEILHSESMKFVSALTKNYPKTLYDRISLASNGSVVDGEVKPKSVFKKILTVINRFMREED